LTVRAPVPGARFVVELAASRLPTPADRRRYQAEFVAELYGEPALVQFRRALGVLSHTHALRAPQRCRRMAGGAASAAARPAAALLCAALALLGQVQHGRRRALLGVRGVGKDRPGGPHWAAGGLMHCISGGGGAVGGF
jgi:hypothetical protein